MKIVCWVIINFFTSIVDLFSANLENLVNHQGQKKDFLDSCILYVAMLAKEMTAIMFTNILFIVN